MIQRKGYRSDVHKTITAAAKTI